MNFKDMVVDRWGLCVECVKFKQDYRARLPPIISRFTGYRAPGTKSPYEPVPIPPFTWLHKIPLRYETWLFGFLGAFGSVLSIEAIMATDTVFRNDYGAPIIVTSFGASAVLLFTVIESPLSQPRNFLLGHFISALVGICITRLFVLDRAYRTELNNTSFHGNTFVNGGLSMAFSILAQDIFGAIHPPAGATGLNAAVEPGIVKLSWRYLPVILASSLVMLGWALLVNNLGRRRYPVYWWNDENSMVRQGDGKNDLCDLEKELRGVESDDLEHAVYGCTGPDSTSDHLSDITDREGGDNSSDRHTNPDTTLETMIQQLHSTNAAAHAK